MEQRIILLPKNIDSVAINMKIHINIPGETNTDLSNNSASNNYQAKPKIILYNL